MSIAVGIDLGTTNSAISYIKDGNVQMIPIEGKNTFPSVIAVRNGEILSGQQAKSRLLIDPDNTLSPFLTKIFSLSPVRAEVSK